MIWPWTTLTRLREYITYLERQDSRRIQQVTTYENMALKAMRELAAANRGIRRLKEKLKKKGAG